MANKKKLSFFQICKLWIVQFFAQLFQQPAKLKPEVINMHDKHTTQTEGDWELVVKDLSDLLSVDELGNTKLLYAIQKNDFDLANRVLDALHKDFVTVYLTMDNQNGENAISLVSQKIRETNNEHYVALSKRMSALLTDEPKVDVEQYDSALYESSTDEDYSESMSEDEAVAEAIRRSLADIEKLPGGSSAAEKDDAMVLSVIKASITMAQSRPNFRDNSAEAPQCYGSVEAKKPPIIRRPKG